MYSEIMIDRIRYAIRLERADGEQLVITKLGPYHRKDYAVCDSQGEVQACLTREELSAQLKASRPAPSPRLPEGTRPTYILNGDADHGL